MVEYTFSLDNVFGALADQTRRDILSRLVNEPQLTISEIAQPYHLTFAAISKHLKVLEKARLIVKRRRGKQQVVELASDALLDIDEYFKQYRRAWEIRLNSLDQFLKQKS